MAPKLPDRSTVQVEFSPTAWRQVGALPRDSFNRIRNALSGVELGSAQPGPRQTLRLDLGGWFALCNMDEDRKVLTVLGIVQDEPAQR